MSISPPVAVSGDGGPDPSLFPFLAARLMSGDKPKRSPVDPLALPEPNSASELLTPGREWPGTGALSHRRVGWDCGADGRGYKGVCGGGIGGHWCQTCVKRQTWFQTCMCGPKTAT